MMAGLGPTAGLSDPEKRNGRNSYAEGITSTSLRTP